MKTANQPSRLAYAALVVLAALAAVSTPHVGRADNGIWTNTASGGLWSAAANWTNGTVADGSGFTADFNSINVTTDPTVVQLDSARTIGNLIFGDTTTNSAASWTLGNNGVAANLLTLDGVAPTITVNTLAPGKLATISASLSGSAGFTKAGPTTLVLTGTNTVTGVISNTAGRLRLSNDRAVGDGVNNAAGLVISGTGILEFAGVSPLANVPLTLDSTANGFDVGAILNSTTATTNIYGGTVTLLRQTRFGGAGVMQFTNTITGNTNNFIKDSTGRLDLRNSGLVELGTLTGNRGTVQVEAGTILNVTNINIGSGSSVGAGLTLNGGSVTNLGNTRFGTGSGSASGTLTLNSGTLTVTNLAKGAVSFNLNFNGATLIAAASQTAFLPTVTSAKIQAGNAIIDDGGNAITIGASLVADGASPGGGLIKRGAGTLTLTGNNTYAGPTVITNGTLALSGSGAIASSATIALAAGTTLDVSGLGSTFTVAANQILSGYGTVVGNATDVANAQITPGGGGSVGTLNFANDLTLAGGGTLNYDFSSGGSNDVIAVVGTVTLNGVTTINLANWPQPNGFPVGTYELLLATNSLGGSVANFALSHLPGRQDISLAYDTSGSPNKLLLVVSTVPGSAANLVWQGGQNGNAWDVQTTANWLNGLSSDIYYQSDSVLFSNVPGANASVDLVQTVSPGSLVIDSTNNYVFASTGGGFITGPVALVKNGSGTLTLSQTNNYSGGTLISAGTLQLGDGVSNNGLLSGSITNHAMLAVANPQDEILPNNVSGSGQVVKSGTGALTVSGANSFTGGLSVNVGTVNLASLTALGSPSGAAASVGAGAALRFDVASAQTQPGVLNGSGSIVKANQNALTLNQPNGFSGGLTINLGAVYAGHDNALGNGPVTIDNLAGGATVYAQLFLKNGVTITNPINIVNGASFFQGIIETDAGSYSYGSANGSGGAGDTNGATLTGPIAITGSLQRGGHFVGPINGNDWLVIAGPVTNTGSSVGVRNGRVRFSGGGDYATLSVSQGACSIGSNDGVSTNAALSLAGAGAASFDLNGFNQTLAGLTAGPSAAQITNSSAVAGTLTLNLTAPAAFSGPVAGKMNLVLNGSGSLSLATNNYTGDTTVNGGVLALALPNLAAGATVTVSNGAVLQLDFAATNQVGSLVTNGVAAGPGIYDSLTAAPFITGAGSLLVGSPVASYPTNITATVSGSTLTLSWPGTHLGWLAQSNSVNLVDTNFWFDVAHSQVGTNLVISIDPVQTNVFYRLRKP